MPKAHSKSTSSNDEDPHGYINLAEAKAHVDALENLVTMIKNKVEKQEMTDLLENILSNMKEVLANLTPTMQLADTSTVSRAIHDKNFNVLLPRSDTLDQTLEEMLLSEELPDASEVLRVVQGEGEISEGDQRIVAELFSNLELAHDHMAMACGLLSRLSRTLKPSQLLTIIKASIRPLIQLNALATLETPTTQEKPRELPDEQQERVKLMLTPDPQASLLRKEKVNSTTRLLAAYAFKILNKFGTGTTQRQIQETYLVKPKQLSSFLMGRKYLGGSDRKAIARKQKSSDEQEPSTSTR